MRSMQRPTMNVINQIKNDFNAFLAHTFTLDSDTLAKTSLTINCDEQKAEFGDLNSNAAMILAKLLMGLHYHATLIKTAKNQLKKS